VVDGRHGHDRFVVFAGSKTGHPPEVFLWDCKQRTTLTTLPTWVGLPEAFRLSGEGGWLAFRDRVDADLIRLWDCRLNRWHGRLEGSGEAALIGGPMRAAEYSPDHVLLASTSWRLGQPIMRIDELSSCRKIAGASGVVVDFWSDDGRFLLTRGSSVLGTMKQQRTGSYGGGFFRFKGRDHPLDFAQVWEMACPVPTFQVRGPVEQLVVRADGRQLLVNNTLWEVQPNSARIVLRETALSNQGASLGYRGNEVWMVPRAVDKAEQRADSDERVALRRQWWSEEVSETLGLRLLGSANGLGPLAAIGNLIANRGRTRWEQPVLARLLPTNRQVALASPDFERMRAVLGRTEGMLGIAFACMGKVAWSPDGTKMLAITMIGRHQFDSRVNGWWSEGTTLSNINGDPLVGVWDVASGTRRPLAHPRWGCQDIAWHPQSDRFATVGPVYEFGARGTIEIWDLATATVVATVSKEDFDRIVWSNDGKYLLAVKQDKKASVLTPDGVELRSWLAPRKDWTTFRIWSEENCVITGGEDGFVHFLHLETGKEVVRWRGHDAPVTAMTFSPDGKLLVTGARDGSIRVWNLPWIRAELRKLGLDW
jgi:hypothetical protein